MLADTEYSDRFVDSPELLDQDRRWWWCRRCGAVFERHHNATKKQFCNNCSFREAVLIELQAVGNDKKKVK